MRALMANFRLLLLTGFITCSLGLTTSLVGDWAMGTQPTLESTNLAGPDADGQQEDIDWKKIAEEEGIPMETLKAALVPPTLPADRIKALIQGLRVAARTKDLLRERYEAASTELHQRWQFNCRRSIPLLHLLIVSSRHLVDAEAEVCIQKADRLAAYQAHLQRMEKLYKLEEARMKAGRLAAKDLDLTLYYRIEGEIWLRRVKAGENPRGFAGRSTAADVTAPN